MTQLTNDFITVVPVWNGEDTIIQALDSIVAQNYENLGIIIKDDLSTDRTHEALIDYFGIRPDGPIRFRFHGRDILWIRNSIKMYGGGNTYDAVINHTANSEAIIGVVDGDDHLIRCDAFEKISCIYRDQDKWLVWSQHRRKSGNPGHSSVLPDDDRIYTNRNYWAVSHFRTCKAWLFHHIQRQDLIDPFRPGLFMKVACDAALIYPMIELCGNKKAYFLDEILYQYNDQLPTNEDNFYPELVARYSDFIRHQGRTYSKLDTRSLTQLYPCSPKQEEDWETHQDLGPQILYRSISVARYQEKEMEQAFAALVAKHESLRTVFVNHKGKVCQQILEGTRSQGFYLRNLDSPSAEGPGTLRSARQHMQDVSKPPLCFLLVKQHEDGSATLTVVINHIISDYSSHLIIKNDLLTAYDRLVSGDCTPLNPLPLQLKDYILIKNREIDAVKARHEAYWNAKLEPLLLQRMQQLLGSHPGDDGVDPFSKTTGSGRCLFYLNRETYQQATKLADRLNVSILSVFVAAFGLSLSEYFSTPELLISSVVSDRRDQYSAGLIAFLTGAIHMKIRIDHESSHDALVKRTYMEFLRCCRFLIYNYQFLYNRPLRQANTLHITYQAVRDETADFWMAEPGHRTTTPPYFALACNISTAREHCKLEIDYHGGLFVPEKIDRIIELFQNNLENLTKPLPNQSNNHVTPSYQPTNEADLDGAIPR